MARWLKQSTSVDVPIGPFVDSTDGVTAETALTITQPDIRLKKNGGAWAQKNAAQTLSHEENGYYEVTLDATDTNTLGLLRLAVNESGALPVWEDFLVVPANVWDSFFGADLLDVSTTQWNGTAVGSTEVRANLINIAGVAVSTTTAQLGVNVVQISGDATSADNLESYTDGTTPMPVNATQISGDATAADNAEAFFDGTGYAGTGNTIPTVTNVTNLHASAATAAELSKVPKSDGTATWNATALASIQQEATDALNAYDPPTRTEATSDKDEILTAVGDVPTNAELATALGTADDAVLAAIATVDGNVDAIKAKTDSLTFTTAGIVDANVQQINDVTITGDGQVGTEFGV